MSKIIFTVTNDLIYDQRMDRICSVLLNQGYEVTIIGRKKRGTLPLKVKTYQQKRMYCFFNKGKLFYLEYNVRLFLFLLFSKVDIISAVDLDTALPAFWVSKIRSKKFVFDAHEYFTEVIEVVRRPFVKSIWTAIESYVLRRTRYAYTVSESLKNLFEQKYSGVFKVIRNVPMLEKYVEPNKSEKRLVYIGAVNEGRGLEELIDVMPFVNCKLYIYGDGDVYNELIQRVANAGLGEKIVFGGYTEPAKLREFTREAYIGVLLLKNTSLSYYYSLANKFFDYMHAGIPQVVIDFPEYRAINEKYKVAELAELQKESIVKAINKILLDDNYYNLLKSNCYKAREEYNWQNESKKLIDFYKKVVKGESIGKGEIIYE
jgi:glycosyltransferase involved in cell wall biosynthesis